MAKKIIAHYVTSSSFKREEANEMLAMQLTNGQELGNCFDLRFRHERIPERLEIKIETLVREEVIEAYKKIKVPCFVEHAGLVLEEFVECEYPGGLTKPMWDNLKDGFISEIVPEPRAAIAKAVVAATNGKEIVTFTGETKGTLLNDFRGNRNFYWDTIFVPSDGPEKLTYAEIVAKYGVKEKVLKFSQSAKALKKFFDFILEKEKVQQGWWS